MSVINRRALLCALPAIPFIPSEILRPRTTRVQIIISGAVAFAGEATIDQIVEAIKQSIAERDVILFPEHRPHQ